ncbi:MAG: formimidoylglutamase [Gammaproteobacteria bacterium]
MSWNSRYLPPDQTQWQGRADTPPASSFFQIMQMLNLQDNDVADNHQQTFALIGFKCDEGIRRNQGRVGAKEGPGAIRQALAKLPIQKQDFFCYDAGTIVCPDDDLEATQHALGDVVAILLQQGVTPIVMGGGHELAWGHYQGIAKTFPAQNLGIINFDAHFDMRPLLPEHKGSSGTPFLQIAEAHRSANRRFDYNCVGIQHAGNIRLLLETAKSYNSQVIWADDLHMGLLEKSIDFIDRVIDQNEIVYLSLCLDVFAAAAAPGVSAIQPLGLWPWHIIPLVRQLAASGKVASYDIAELSPRYDIDQRTAKLAANLIYEIVHHHHHSKHW